MGRLFWSARPRLPVHRWTCRASMRASSGKKFWIWCARVVDRPVGSCPRAARRTNPRTAESGRRAAKVLPLIPPRRKKTVPAPFLPHASSPDTQLRSAAARSMLSTEAEADSGSDNDKGG